MLIGVVGKTNVGKSTFFKAATLAEVEIANYPFATIKPNHGMGFVKLDCAEKEFNVKCNPKEGFCLKGKRFVPVELLDVAGLVPGAHEGKGMGNQFLDDLRQADALIHIIDASGSTNEKGEPVSAGNYDPAKDIRFLEIELDMWYLGIFKKVWKKFARTVDQEKAEVEKAIEKQFSGLKVTEDMVKETLKELDLNDKQLMKWEESDLLNFVKSLRKKTKPMIIAANKIDTKKAQENMKKLKEEFPEYEIIGCSAESELALREASKHDLIYYTPGEDNFEIKKEMNEKQKKALDFIKTNVLDKFGKTGVQEILNKAVFDLLNNIAVYPVSNNKLEDKDGNILPDCFLVPKGTTALEFAFKIHTDIGKNFVKAINLKTNLPIGKEQPLENNDVIEIMASK